MIPANTRATPVAIGLAVLCTLLLFALPGVANASPQVAAGGEHTCTLDDAGVVRCFGSNRRGQQGRLTNSSSNNPNPVPVVVDVGGAAKQIVAGGSHTCVLLVAGAVKCWGHNLYGQLGSSQFSGTDNSEWIPRTVNFGGAVATELAAGSSHTCAILEGGGLRCFGLNNFGQLGGPTNSGTLNANWSPIAVAVGAVSAVRAGSHHTCAVLDSAALHCFGRNDYGQLGRAINAASNPIPTAVDFGGASITDASLGYMKTCALLATGELRCFGINDRGQLGNALHNGTFTGNAVPAPVPLGTTAQKALGGSDHSCALLTDGALGCFGRNTNGQLGHASNLDAANPVPVSVNLGGQRAISADGGNSHTCVLAGDGLVRCFGSNTHGQLGSDQNAGFNFANFSPLLVEGLRLFTPSPPAPPADPVGSVPAAPRIISAPKKVRYAKRRVKLTVNCPAGCRLVTVVRVGKRDYRVAKVTVAASSKSRSVTVRWKANRAVVKRLRAGRRAKLRVQLVANAQTSRTRQINLAR